MHDYALSDLSPQISGQIESHLEQCSDCRQYFMAEKAYCQNLGTVRESYCLPCQDKDLHSAVMEKLANQTPALTPPATVRRFPLATAAALVLVFAAAIFAMRTGNMDNLSSNQLPDASAQSNTESAADNSANQDPLNQYKSASFVPAGDISQDDTAQVDTQIGTSYNFSLFSDTAEAETAQLSCDFYNQQESVKIANPILPMESSDDFLKLGITLLAPENAENCSYFTVLNQIARINFTLGQMDFTLSASNLTDDVSGVYDTFEKTIFSSRPDSISVKIDYNENGGAVAEWSKDQTHYSLFCPDITAIDDFEEIALCIK